MGGEESEEGIYDCLGTVLLRWNGFNYLIWYAFVTFCLSLSLSFLRAQNILPI